MSSKPITCLLVASLGLWLGSCDQSVTTVNPTFPNGGLLRFATPAPQGALDQLQGIFETGSGSDLIGHHAVTKTSPGVFSLFHDVEAGYAVMQGGCLDEDDAGAGIRLVLEGYWRHGLTSRAGLIRLEVQPDALAEQLCNGETLVSRTGLVLTGLYGEADDAPKLPISVGFQKNLIDYIGKFLVAGHHGACPNFSDCGASINSIETMRLMPALGADVAELDVRMTKDGVAVLFHDPSFTSSMVVGRYCNGALTHFSMDAIRANCRLIHGEQLPTLEEALKAAVDETGLRGMWLDTKVADAIPSEIALVKKYNDYAKSKGRTFLAVVGIPTEAVLDAWKAAPDHEGTPCLLEYDPTLVIPNGCFVWGPTWTAGPRADDVHMLQAQNKATIFWTVNGTDYVDLFLRESNPNGFVTDRPSHVFYQYQMRGVVPAGGFNP
jgi:glycerophosphoryl diester phosphodiesterase